MKIFFDTNVLLDALVEGRTGGEEARQLILAVAQDQAEGFLGANCIADIYCAARKFLGDSRTHEAIYDLMAIFKVMSVGEDDCLSALETPMGDFDDALLAVCALRAGADYIVTRDERFLSASGCPVKIAAPATMLSILGVDVSGEKN